MDESRLTRTYPPVGLFSGIGIIIMVIFAGITMAIDRLFFGRDTFKEWEIGRLHAEQNEKHICGVWYRDVHDTSLSEEEREYLNRKWTIIGRGFQEMLYDCGGIHENVAICRDFMKQYNINLHSEDFDPEYVSRCVRDWKYDV